MPFSVTIRNRLTDKDRKECIIYTGTTEFEKVYFSAGDNEAASLVSAFANSKNFTANLEESAKGIMTNVNQTAFTGGKNPTVATTTPRIPEINITFVLSGTYLLIVAI